LKDRNLQSGDDWETPKELYAKLNDEFHFDFDPCPLHADFNGLILEWGDYNFINPPYSRKIKEEFIKRAHWLWKTQNKTSVLLLPVSTSTKIFHEYIYIIKPRSDSLKVELNLKALILKAKLCLISVVCTIQ
jgi:hypothetical protein